MSEEIVLMFENTDNWSKTWKFNASNDMVFILKTKSEEKKCQRIEETDTPEGTMAIIFKWEDFPNIALKLPEGVEVFGAIHTRDPNEFNDYKKSIPATLSLTDSALSNAIEYSFGVNTPSKNPFYDFAQVVNGNEDSKKAAFLKLIEFIKKKLNETSGRKTLCRFLPLDIDMQALKKLLNDEKKKEAITYLKEILTDIEDSFFINKLNDAKKDIEGITDEDYRKELHALSNQPDISTLLTLLDSLTQRNKQKKEDLTEKLLQHTQCLNTVTLFHGWYCEFTKCAMSFNDKTTNRNPGTAV